MKSSHRHRRSKRGGVLLTAMIVVFGLAIALTGYLSLTRYLVKNTNRTLYLTAAVDLAETGIEHAMWALNAAADGEADAWTGWTHDTDNIWRTFNGFNYSAGNVGQVKVFVSNYRSAGATIVARARITLTNGQTVEKWIKGVLKGRSLFEYGLLTREPISAGGGNVFDSWISDPDGDPGTPSISYSPNIARSNGGIATTSTATPAISLGGSAKVYGKVSVGAKTEATITYGGLGGASTNWNPTSVNGNVGLRQDWGSTVGEIGDPSEYLRQDYLLPGFMATFEEIAAPGGLPDHVIANYVLAYNDPAQNNAYINTETLGLTGTSTTYRMDQLTVNANGVLTIVGDVTLILPRSDQTVFQIIQGGSLTIADGASLKIYTPGNIAINGGASAGIINRNATDSLQIWSTRALGSTGQTIYLDGAGSLRGVIYAPEAALSMPGGTHLYGAAVVRSLSMSGSGQIHYDESLKDSAGGAGGAVALKSYKELNTPEERQPYLTHVAF